MGLSEGGARPAMERKHSCKRKLSQQRRRKRVILSSDDEESKIPDVMLIKYPSLPTHDCFLVASLVTSYDELVSGLGPPLRGRSKEIPFIWILLFIRPGKESVLTVYYKATVHHGRLESENRIVSLKKGTWLIGADNELTDNDVDYLTREFGREVNKVLIQG